MDKVSNSLGDTEGYGRINELQQSINDQINLINDYIDLIGEINNLVRSDELKINITQKNIDNINEIEASKMAIEEGIKKFSNQLDQGKYPAEHFESLEILRKKLIAHVNEILGSEDEIKSVPDEIVDLSKDFANKVQSQEEKFEYDVDFHNRISSLEEIDPSDIEKKLREEIGHQFRRDSWGWKAKSEVDNLIGSIEGTENQKGLVNRLKKMEGTDFQQFIMPSFKTRYFIDFKASPNVDILKRTLYNVKIVLEGIEFIWDDRSNYPSLIETFEDCREDLKKVEEVIQMADEGKWKKTFGGKWKELRNFYEKLETGQSVKDYMKDPKSLKDLESLSDEGYIDIIISKE